MDIYANISRFFDRYEMGYYIVNNRQCRYIIYKKSDKATAITSWVTVAKQIPDGSLTLAHFFPAFSEKGPLQNEYFNTAFCLIIKHAMFFMNVKPGIKIILSTSQTGFSFLMKLKSSFDFNFTMHHGPIHDILKKIGFDIVVEGFIPQTLSMFPEIPFVQISNPSEFDDNGSYLMP